jgi:hypothetical protein
LHLPVQFEAYTYKPGGGGTGREEAKARVWFFPPPHLLRSPRLGLLRVLLLPPPGRRRPLAIEFRDGQRR